MLLVLFFTFSRTECPCPKNFTGPESWDDKKHWTVGDFVLARVGQAAWALHSRMKAYKQDPRIQRPEASHAADWLPFDSTQGGDRTGRDWVVIGDVDNDTFSISRWYMRYTQLVGRERSDAEPMFLARDRQRPYTYTCLIYNGA